VDNTSSEQDVHRVLE